jgi:putative ABC transport system substrate-binding protein
MREIKRREFITLLCAPVTWPITAQAQQQPVPVVGFLYPGTPEQSAHLVAAFRKGLSEAGYEEGRNVAIEYRFAQNEFGRLPQLAADLVSHRVAVIATDTSNASLAAKAATTMIPIVFTAPADPVQIGLVASFNRPGGNITGISSMNAELGAKRLGLLHELLPGASRIAVLSGTGGPAVQSTMSELQAVAPAIGVQLERFTANTIVEIDVAFESLVQKRFDAVLVTQSPLFQTRRVQLATLAAHHRIPVIYTDRENVVAGGLMSYGPNLADQHRQVGIYVARILKGENPGGLPVIRAAKFEFIINLQTAKLLRLTFPPGLLAIADEVIE